MINHNRISRIIKKSAILGMILIAFSVLLAWQNPATGYELDIYGSTPLLTWILLGISMAVGAGIVLHQILTKGYKNNRLWVLGFALLVVSRLALLWIPYIRNYFTWGGDNIDHWGMVIDVINTGHLYSENSYPVAHSLLSQTILVTGLPLNIVTNLSTGLFSAFYILLIYLLSRVLTPSRSHQLMAVVISGFIVIMGGYNVFLMPNGWSILILPLLLLLYFKKFEAPAYSLPFILVLVLYPFFHPLSALMTGFSLLVMFFVGVIMFYWQRKAIIDYQEPGINSASGTLTPALILFVVLIPWILSFNQFIPNIRSMWAQITSGGPAVLSDISDTLLKINMTGWDTVILFFKLYGVTAFMILIALAGFIITVVQIKRNKQYSQLNPLLYTGSLVLFFGMLYLLYIIGFPGMASIGAQRMLSYVQVFAPVLGAFGLVELIKKSRPKAAVVAVVSLVLIFTSFLSIRGLYYAPYRLQPNGQITQMSLVGAEWFINNKNVSQKAANVMSPINWYAHGILGMSEASKRQDLGWRRITQMPDHFGYEEYHTVGEQYSETLLMNITKQDKIIYDTVWDMVDRFDLEDFQMLDTDKTVKKLYTNGQFETYYVE